MSYTKKAKSKCWDCKNFCGGCSWSKEFKPIDGWTADFVGTKSTKGYKVIDCPLFEKGDVKKINATEIEITNLYSAVVKKLIRDLKCALIDYQIYKENYRSAIILSKAAKRSLTCKKQRLDNITRDFYHGILKDIVGDEEILYNLMDDILNEVEDDIKILTEYANNAKIKDLEEKYGKEKTTKALEIWRSVRDCFIRGKRV